MIIELKYNELDMDKFLKHVTAISKRFPEDLVQFAEGAGQAYINFTQKGIRKGEFPVKSLSRSTIRKKMQSGLSASRAARPWLWRDDPNSLINQMSYKVRSTRGIRGNTLLIAGFLDNKDYVGGKYSNWVGSAASLASYLNRRRPIFRVAKQSFANSAMFRAEVAKLIQNVRSKNYPDMSRAEKAAFTRFIKRNS